jgi:putative PIN family toxin of toxin-antitoxin system
LIRAVVDPGVLVSAFITQRGSAPDRIVRAWHEGAFELVVSAHLFSELAAVLARPKFAKQSGEGRAEAYISVLATGALFFDDPPDPPRVTRDPGDDYLVALARATGADCIVSGDPHLTELARPNPPVLSPRQFADRLSREGLV